MGYSSLPSPLRSIIRSFIGDDRYPDYQSSYEYDDMCCDFECYNSTPFCTRACADYYFEEDISSTYSDDSVPEFPTPRSTYSSISG